MKQIAKEVRRACGKDYYLLGRNTEGKKVWLESAHWDCDWYWGFGYIEVFNRSNPDTSTDISSHTHWKGGVIGKYEYYDHNKQTWKQSDYYHHFNDNKRLFKATTLTDKESWELAKLMGTWETLKDTAEVLGRGGSHITTNPLAELVKNTDEVTRINKIVMPEIFKAVYKLLTA
jgi:hypothetical protein